MKFLSLLVIFRKKYTIVFLLFFVIGVAYADNDMQLRGKYFACQDNQKMNLWDISNSSPLIRDEMLRKHYCWKTIPGIRIYVVDYVGKFARVNNNKGLNDYLVYASDLTKVTLPKAEPLPTTRQINKVKLISVKTSWPSKDIRFDFDPKNTAEIDVKVDDKFKIFFYVLRSKISEGFDVKIENQFNPNMLVGGQCDDAGVGVGKPDFYRIKVIRIDHLKRQASFLISGYKEKCSNAAPITYNINDAELVISGRNFNELMRPVAEGANNKNR